MKSLENRGFGLVALAYVSPLLLAVVNCGGATEITNPGGSAGSPAGGHSATSGGSPWGTGGAQTATGGSISVTGGSHTGGSPPASGGKLNATGGSPPASGGKLNATGGSPPASGGYSSSTGGKTVGTGGSLPTGGKTSGTGGKTLGTGGLLPIGGGGSAATGGNVSQSGGSSNGGSASTGGSNAAGAAGSGGTSGICPPMYLADTSIVLIPDASSPQNVAASCAYTGYSTTLPAVRISLLPSGTSPALYSGTVTVAPELVTLDGIGTTVQGVQIFAGNGATVSAGASTSGVYSFQLTWPSESPPALTDSLTLQVSLTVHCAPQASSIRQVNVQATVKWCGSSQNSGWVTSGDICTICRPALGA